MGFESGPSAEELEVEPQQKSDEQPPSTKQKPEKVKQKGEVEDLKERRRIGVDFVEAVRQKVGKFPLRFHGMSFDSLSEILKSGNLTSGVDRTGIQTSFDSSGEISVTSPATIETTIGNVEKGLELRAKGNSKVRAGYIGIIDTDAPVGSTFVLVPKDREDADIGENESKNLRNIYDLKNGQLIAILTGTKTKDEVIKLVDQLGYSGISVMTYDEFGNNPQPTMNEAQKRFPYVSEYVAPAKREGIQIEL